MIIKSAPLSASESKEYLGKEHETLKSFINKFTELNAKQAKDFRKKLEDLNLMKLNAKNISKVIDIMPANLEEINKIFTDISLDENEANKILDIVKQFE
ncbi:hypothetical protein HYS72_00910 [Candidatus Pacearchaeota archaeon]|nr:hypothetical protein [Candidatus Pacearchaeota archaeon]MBI2057154.1 hypothetical protein [Candidatus Pacearchaeota archaeon]